MPPISKMRPNLLTKLTFPHIRFNTEAANLPVMPSRLQQSRLRLFLTSYLSFEHSAYCTRVCSNSMCLFISSQALPYVCLVAQYARLLIPLCYFKLQAHAKSQ